MPVWKLTNFNLNYVWQWGGGPQSCDPWISASFHWWVRQALVSSTFSAHSLLSYCRKWVPFPNISDLNMVLRNLLSLWKKKKSSFCGECLPRRIFPILSHLTRNNKPHVCLHHYWERVRQITTSRKSPQQDSCHLTVSRLFTPNQRPFKGSKLHLLSGVSEYVLTCLSKTTSSWWLNSLSGSTCDCVLRSL